MSNNDYKRFTEQIKSALALAKTNESDKFEDASAFDIRKTTFIFNDTTQKVNIKRELLDTPYHDLNLARRVLVDIFKRGCSEKATECCLFQFYCYINIGDTKYEYEIIGV